MTDAYETGLVQAWREKGRGWQTIAENLRKPVEDVRRLYDRGFKATIAPAPIAEFPTVQIPMNGYRVRERNTELKALRTLYEAKGLMAKRPLGNGLLMAVTRMNSRYGESLFREPPAGGIALTPKGRRLYEFLVQGGGV